MKPLYMGIHDADRLKTALIVTCLLFSSLFPASRASAVPGTISKGDYDRLIPELMEQAEIPGMSVVVLRNSHVSYVGNFGVADNETISVEVSSMRIEITPRTFLWPLQVGMRTSPLGVNKSLRRRWKNRPLIYQRIVRSRKNKE